MVPACSSQNPNSLPVRNASRASSLMFFAPAHGPCIPCDGEHLAPDTNPAKAIGKPGVHCICQAAADAAVILTPSMEHEASRGSPENT